MRTRLQIAVAAVALATVALGCGGEEMPAGGAPPVAAPDSAITDLDTPIRLHPTANDVADSVCLAAQTLDLDPATDGQQDRYVTAAGTFALEANGDVLFTPTPGFSGQAIASYVVADVAGRISNPADLFVIVRAPQAALGADLPQTVPAPAPLPRLVPASLGGGE